jgi:AraC-like DNA-binding protein
MEKEQLYLDPELNLNHLAAHLDIHPKMLSAVLNQVLQKGFSEYVNAWRVEAVKRMILDPDKQHLTITGIAYDCGFNSQPTFQRAFKAATGQTPSNYIRNAIQFRN